MLVVVSPVCSAPTAGSCLDERQDIVYRRPRARSGTAPEPPLGAGSPAGLALRRGPAPEDGWDVVTDPTVLMRFSAATANAHRIHYDWPYATGVEGYPGLVVHGPLMTLAAGRGRCGRPASAGPGALQHRNRAPLFCGQPARITHEHHPSGVLSLLSGADGAPRTTLDAHPLEKGTHHA